MLVLKAGLCIKKRLAFFQRFGQQSLPKICAKSRVSGHLFGQLFADKKLAFCELKAGQKAAKNAIFRTAFWPAFSWKKASFLSAKAGQKAA